MDSKKLTKEEFFKFVMWYEGELIVNKGKAYANGVCVAEIKKTN